MAKKPKFLYLDIYRRNVYFFIGWSEEEFRYYCKKFFDMVRDCSDADGITTVETKTGKNIILVWVSKSKNPAIFCDNLAHECLHAANQILGDVGVEPSFENDEPQTYLLGYLIRYALSK